MQKHTKRQLKDNFKWNIYIRCLCVISEKTEMPKKKIIYDNTNNTRKTLLLQ